MNLPEGYRLDRTDPDLPVLRDPDGEAAARFGPGYTDTEVEKAAEDHQRRRDYRELAVSALLGLIVGVALGWGAGLESALW